MTSFRRRHQGRRPGCGPGQLTGLQREQFISYKATGWFTVAAGATVLALGETWQLVEHYGWPAWLFWLLIVAMITLALLNTAVRKISDEHTRHYAGPEPAPAAEPR